MRRALLNGRVLTDAGWTAGRAVLLEGDRIAALVDPGDPRCRDAQRRDLGGALLLPGFIDVQVNGGGGALFNDDPSVETIRRIAAAHRRFGTTSLLPTLITDHMPVVARAIAATRASIEAGVPGVNGVHHEGPCLNAARKGAPDASRVRDLGPDEIALVGSAGAGRTLVTLAPEMTSTRTIAALASAGIVVCAGHTNATAAQVAAALASGLRGFTHLFNAMSQITAREPGVVGAALADEESWCGLIVDGHHVDPRVLRLALRCKRGDRFFLVTDAMPTVGTPERSFVLQGRAISVEEGRCVDEAGTLSGSALDMASAVRNASAMLGIDLAQAVRMASTYPAEFLGLGHELGRIAPGYRANLVLAGEDLRVLETWIDGRPSD